MYVQAVSSTYRDIQAK